MKEVIKYAQMSSRGPQSLTKVRVHYVLASRLRKVEGRSVEEVNEMLIEGLGLDGKTKGKHAPAESTVRGWVRDSSDLPEKTYRSQSVAQAAILPDFLPYWGSDEFHAGQNHRLVVMSQGVHGFPISQQNQSGDSPGPSLLLKFLGAAGVGAAVFGVAAVVGGLMDETPRKADSSHFPRKLSILRRQWRSIQMRNAAQAPTPPERNISGIMAYARSRRQSTPGAALARLRADRGL